MQQLRARELGDWLTDDSRQHPVLVDVREPWELEMCSLPNIVHIPMHMLPARCNELNPDDEIVLVCHHGVRSMQAAMFLERQGFTALYNLTGGVDAWAGEVDPKFRRY